MSRQLRSEWVKRTDVLGGTYAIARQDRLVESIEGGQDSVACGGGCRLALIHLALEKNLFPGLAGPTRTAPKPERIFRPQARLAVQAGNFQQLFFRMIGERPFRCGRGRGGEDSCGGF